MREPADSSDPDAPADATSHVTRNVLGRETGVPVIDSVLRADWRPEHCLDEGHFFVPGNQAFADTIAPDIAFRCRSRPTD